MISRNAELRSCGRRRNQQLGLQCLQSWLVSPLIFLSECRIDFEPSQRLNPWLQAILWGYATKIWLMGLVGNERMSSGLRRWFKFDVAGMLSGEASQKSVFCS